jgi:hypothetical protein
MGTPSAEDTIHEQDKAKRLEEEAEILQKAHALTNGSAGNQKLIGEVLQWQVKNSIEHNTLLRIVIATQASFQLRADCEELHNTKTWPVRVFGTSYSVPITTAVCIIGLFSYLWLHKNNII